MAEQPTITLELTQEQQLEVLAATGLLVKTLELPLEALADGGEALARLPIPDWLQQPAASSEGKEVNEDGREAHDQARPDQRAEGADPAGDGQRGPHAEAGGAGDAARAKGPHQLTSLSGRPRVRVGLPGQAHRRAAHGVG
jgi:hypothetical protein